MQKRSFTFIYLILSLLCVTSKLPSLTPRPFTTVYLVPSLKDKEEQTLEYIFQKVPNFTICYTSARSQDYENAQRLVQGRSIPIQQDPRIGKDDSIFKALWEVREQLFDCLYDIGRKDYFNNVLVVADLCVLYQLLAELQHLYAPCCFRDISPKGYVKIVNRVWKPKNDWWEIVSMEPIFLTEQQNKK